MDGFLEARWCQLRCEIEVVKSHLTRELEAICEQQSKFRADIEELQGDHRTSEAEQIQILNDVAAIKGQLVDSMKAMSSQHAAVSACVDSLRNETLDKTRSLEVALQGQDT